MLKFRLGKKRFWRPIVVSVSKRNEKLENRKAFGFALKDVTSDFFDITF